MGSLFLTRKAGRHYNEEQNKWAHKAVSPPKVTNRAVLDPGGGNRCSPEYLSSKKLSIRFAPKAVMR